MKIGVIGAGWYGSHIGLSLKKQGHDVTIFEKNSDIFTQISGNFGIRLHVGPHYPRSKKTRESCRRDFQLFIDTYPQLVVNHEYAIYALGELDSDKNPSKVNFEQFKAVCEESDSAKQINVKEAGYKDLIAAWDIYEPSMALGDGLRNIFKRYLSDAGVQTLCNFNVQVLDQSDSLMSITSDKGQTHEGFDYIINASSYQSFVDVKNELPFDINVVYQPCLAMMYEDTHTTTRPFSFIIMDGWFPCIMPYCNKEEDLIDEPRDNRKYILTHGKWTIMGSFNTSKEAQNLLSRLNDNFIADNIKPNCEAEINRFWPDFEKRFRYIGWKGEVLAKIKTEKEFRSAVTFEKDRLVHIIPGKVSNIFDASREVVAIINQQNVSTKNGYQYVTGGVLDDALQEITEVPDRLAQSTCNLQTYKQFFPVTPANINSFWSPNAGDNGGSVSDQNTFKP
jgi:hypothetical protein